MAFLGGASSTAHSGNPTNTQLRLYEIDQKYRTIRTAVRAAAWMFAAWCGYLLGDSLAGKLTGVNIDVSMLLAALADLKVGILVGLTGMAAAWAVVERYVRQRMVEKLHARVKALEVAIDPNRTSSGLTLRGRTHPDDREEQ
jgi:hypothetical protein